MHISQQPTVGQVFFIIEASRSHSDTPHTLGVLWTSGQPYAKTSATTFTPDGIRTRNPSKRAAADPRLRPRGHWYRRRGDCVEAGDGWCRGEAVLTCPCNWLFEDKIKLPFYKRFSSYLTENTICFHYIFVIYQLLCLFN